MKILVTGGSGYIGSILVPELIKLNYEVTVIDNFMYKQSSLNHLCLFNNFTIINGDIRDKILMKSLLKNNDLIITAIIKAYNRVFIFSIITCKKEFFINNLLPQMLKHIFFHLKLIKKLYIFFLKCD